MLAPQTTLQKSTGQKGREKTVERTRREQEAEMVKAAVMMGVKGDTTSSTLELFAFKDNERLVTAEIKALEAVDHNLGLRAIESAYKCVNTVRQEISNKLFSPLALTH